jgi:hypothetical protein
MSLQSARWWRPRLCLRRGWFASRSESSARRNNSIDRSQMYTHTHAMPSKVIETIDRYPIFVPHHNSWWCVWSSCGSGSGSSRCPLLVMVHESSLAQFRQRGLLMLSACLCPSLPASAVFTCSSCRLLLWMAPWWRRGAVRGARCLCEAQARDKASRVYFFSKKGDGGEAHFTPQILTW